jgi:hypothetical protein
MSLRVKLMVVTCGFYLAAALLLQIAIFRIGWWKSEFLLYFTRWGLAIAFGLV